MSCTKDQLLWKGRRRRWCWLVKRLGARRLIGSSHYQRCPQSPTTASVNSITPLQRDPGMTGCSIRMAARHCLRQLVPAHRPFSPVGVAGGEGRCGSAKPLLAQCLRPNKSRRQTTALVVPAFLTTTALTSSTRFAAIATLLTQQETSDSFCILLAFYIAFPPDESFAIVSYAVKTRFAMCKHGL